MQIFLEKIEDIFHSSKEYINLRIDEVKLDLAEKMAILLSNLIAKMIIGLMLVLFLFFGSFALAFALGDYFNNTWLGFLLISIFYLSLAIIVWITRVQLIQIPILNSFLKQLFTQDDEN